MPRAYTIAAAALALDVDVKWLDNALSHLTVPGVVQRRQGVARRLSAESLVLLTVTVLLNRSLAVPLARALEIAGHVISAAGKISLDTNLQLIVNLDKLRVELIDRLETAVEIAPVPRRGRPPKNTTGRLA